MTAFSQRQGSPASGGRMTARVLVADAFESAGLNALRDLGCETLHEPELTAADLPARLATLQPEVLVVRETAVTAAAMEASSRLALVVQAGAGIVADSDPADEDLECHNKARALLATVPAAERMTRARRRNGTRA